MSELLKPFVASAIRAGLNVVGGWLLTVGISADQVEALIGAAFAIVVSLAWSYIDRLGKKPVEE